MKKLLSMILISTLTLGLLAGCGGGSDNGSEAEKQTGKDAIKVNDTVLKTDYLDKRIEQVFKHNQVQADDPIADYYRAQIIEGLVNTELIKQEAERRNIKITDEDLKKMKEQSIESYGSEEHFKSYMEQYNVSEEDFENMMREQLRYEKLTDELRKDIEVDPEAYYKENKEQFKVPEQVKAAHILVQDEDKAKEIIKKLEDGEDFAKLAKENSEDPGSKENGGDLGFFSADMMVPEFSEVAFNTKPGTFTKEPVKSQFGYHIIRVDEKKEAHDQTFEEVKDQITEQLTENQLREKFQEMMDKLKKEAKIEYLLDEYNPEKLMEKAEKAMQESQAEAQAETSEQAAAPAEDGKAEVKVQEEKASDAEADKAKEDKAE